MTADNPGVHIRSSTAEDFDGFYGFAHEGVHRRGRIIDGRVEDVLMMGLLLGSGRSESG